MERALALTALREPISVLRVEQGRAGDLVFAPTGFVRNAEDGARELAKRQRPAWVVSLMGLYPIDCGDVDKCPLVPTRYQLAIDRETGEILLQVVGGDNDDAQS